MFKKPQRFYLMKLVSAEVIEDIFTRMGLFLENEDDAAKKQ
jgi:hypothetical protein